MTIKQFTFNHFATNCYLLINETTKQCAIVDPCMEYDTEREQLDQYITQQGLTPILLLVTHPHVDHIVGMRHLYERYGLSPVLHHKADKMIRMVEPYSAVLGFKVEGLDDIPITYVDDNAVIPFGNIDIEARYVPGHCEGSFCYVIHSEKIVLTGDVLFHTSIGRTDLPGGNFDLLMEKLRTRVLTLDDDYQVLPGHSDTTSIGEEKTCNYFLIDHC